MGAQPVKQVLNVGPNGVGGQEQPLADRGPGEPVHETLQDLPLPAAQHVERAQLAMHPPVQHLGQQHGRNPGLLPVRATHRGQQFAHRLVLGHPAADAVLQRLGHPADVVVGPGQVDDVRARADLAQRAADVDAVLVPEIGVDDGHVDASGGRDRHRLRSGRGRAHQVQVVLGRQPASQRLGHHRVVVDDEDGYLHAWR